MHNSTENNLRFKIVFTENNIRYLLGETPRNEALIAQHRQTIAEDEAKLAEILQHKANNTQGKE